MSGPMAASAGAGPPDARLATRMFTPARFAVPPNYGAAGVLIFPRMPSTPAARARYDRFCRGYFTLADSGSSDFAPAQQMVTVWPLVELERPVSVPAPRTEQDLASLCRRSVDGYAYDAARGILARLPAEARFRSDARGPFLIAWAPARLAGRRNVPVLTYDLSDFEQAGAIEAAFGVWAHQVEQDSRLWRGGKGWNPERWRLNQQARLDRYGPTILKGIKLSSPRK
jgi:hypothetical protein